MCLPDSVAQGFFGKPSHGLPDDRLLALLLELMDRGDIVALDENRNRVRPAAESIRLEMRYRSPQERKRCLAYQLTDQGGARWESVARPDWARFVSVSESTDGDGREETIEVTAQRRDLVARYVDLIYLRPQTRIAGSEEWQLIEPWQATYWKRLPFGHCLRFRWTPNSGIRLSSQADDFLNAVNAWYTAPLFAEGEE
jgi:hypothetical protein